jgi:hypothetical protein
MKKLIYMLLLVLVFKLPAFAQTNTWFETFETGENWTLDLNWSVLGGKLEFYWTPQIPNFDLSAVSQVISLPENVYDLTVTQHLNVFTGTGNEFAEIRLIVDGNPVVLWNYNLIDGNWGSSSGDDISFVVEDYAGQDVQLAFRTYGIDTYNWNWWQIFEVKMSALFENDLAVTDFSGPAKVELLETGTWNVEVTNMGSLAQDEFSILLFDLKTGDMIGTIENPGSIGPQQTMDYSFDWYSAAAYNTAFYGMVITNGDQFSQNNVSNSHFVRIEPDIEYDILVWDNDNGILTVVDPEKGDEIEPSKGLMNALDEAGMEISYVTSLPEDLSDYEIIFSTMGCFCVD